MNTKHRIYYIALVALSLAAISLVGCSDNNDGGGVGPQNTLTAEEQFQLIDQFVDIDTSLNTTSDVFGFGPLELGLGIVHGELIGGVDAGTVGNLEIPGLSKILPHGIDAASITIQYAEDQWEISIDSTRTDADGVKAVNLDLQIRFEDASGHRQMIPDETTAKFIELADIDATVNQTNLAGSTNLNWKATSEATIEISQTGSATLNSSMNGTLTVGYVSDMSSYTFVLGVDGQTTGLTVPSLEQSCPQSGSMTVVLDLLYDSTNFGSDINHVDATWTINAAIQSGGSVNASIQSGDFSRAIEEDFECGS